jgi:hypothetical protein
MAPANPSPGLESVALTLRNTSRWLATDFQVNSMIEGPLTDGCLRGCTGSPHSSTLTVRDAAVPERNSSARAERAQPPQYGPW